MLEGEVSGGGGDAVEAGAVQDDGERDVGAGGVVAGGEAGSGEAGVFGEGGIADVMVDFDGPVAAVPGEQLLGRGPVGGDGGEAVDVLGGGGAVAPVAGVGPAAGDAEDLGDVGVVEEAWERGQDVDGALLDAPVGLADGFLEVAGRVPLPVEGAEELVGLGGVFLDGHQVVGVVGGDEEAGGLARGVERIDGEQPPRDRHLFEQGFGRPRSRRPPRGSRGLRAAARCRARRGLRFRSGRRRGGWRRECALPSMAIACPRASRGIA